MKPTIARFFFILLLFSGISYAGNKDIICNGIPWFDDHGNIVNAHGACIVEDGGKYYLFGELKSDESNAYSGFSCYSSDDLVNWKYENVVLRVQKDGILGPNRVGERVKVMKCPSTGEYVMYMHTDDMNYKNPQIGYATCKTIMGDYEFQGPLLFEGQPIRRWDMGTYQDSDGKGYLLIHHGIIYRLSEDYRSAEARVLNGLPKSGESPAMFKKKGMYYMLFSGLTSWEKNDNFYFTSSAIEGPWTRQGLFTPEGSLTYNSQSTFVLPLKRGNDTVPMYMGDRWSFPCQASAATCVWLPLQVDGVKLSIPEYWESWNVQKVQKMDLLKNRKKVTRKKIRFINELAWESDLTRLSSKEKGSALQVPFRGKQIAILGETNDHSGYARVTIYDKNKKIIKSSLVDFYSKVPNQGIRYLSPDLPKGKYTLEVEVTGIIPVWTDKSKARFGSFDSYVNVDDIIVL
ncbi:MAG: family 43 glycosylhydrolase [Paludibacteraceae bacterium]